jgi:hypothetical protein
MRERWIALSVFALVGVVLTLNLGYSLKQGLKAFAVESEASAQEAAAPAPDVSDEPPEAQELTPAEWKYLLKSKDLLRSAEVLGGRLTKAAPLWWDEYLPLIREIDKLTARLRAPHGPQEDAALLKEYQAIEIRFIALNEKVETNVRRFEAAFEVAQILIGTPPESMSDKGRRILEGLSERLARAEAATREALLLHHILENPEDKKNGWSCRSVIFTLMGQLQRLFFTTPAPR